MEKHFIEFLNIYFWVYIFSFIGYSLAYYLDDEYKKNIQKYSHTHPKLFKIISLVLFIMSMKVIIYANFF